jgi:hypothetical protein
MAEEVRVTVDDSGVRATIDMLMQRLQPSALRGFLATRAHEQLKHRAESRFENEGDDAVGSWAQLAYMTGRVRSFQGFGPFHPINVRTGQLKNFVLNTFTIREMASGATLSMPGQASGKLLSKFRTAQQGGYAPGGATKSGFGRGNASATRGESGPNRSAPARPVVALSEFDSTLIQHELLDWVRQGIF